MTDYQTIPASDLAKLGGRGLVIDVRTGMERDEKRLATPHAHVPLDQLAPRDVMQRHGLDLDADVYLVCRSGARARQAADKFVAAGYKNVHVVDGGIVACEDCGHPVEGDVPPAGGASCAMPATGRATGPIPLERQVRIAAGLLAGIGAFLALAAHPYFALLPLFVGGGLVFAGVTDRCGMALVLTRAPWNKKATAPTCGLRSAGSIGTKTGGCS